MRDMTYIMTFQPSNSWAAYSEVTGQIDRPVQGRLLVPGVVELDGSRLWWSESAETSRRPGAVLEGFLELAEASPELIRDYARQWGLLKICRHGLPCSHHATARAAADTVSAVNLVNSCAAKHQILKRRNAQEFLRELRLALAAREADSAGCEPLRPGQTSGLPKKAYAWEPIELWRTFSHQARSILEIADRLKQRKVGDPSDWAVALYGVWSSCPLVGSDTPSGTLGASVCAQRMADLGRCTTIDLLARPPGRESITLGRICFRL